VQWRNEVRWSLGQETHLAPTCSNLRSFWSKCTVFKKVLMTFLWLFSPQYFGARGIVPTCTHSLRLRCYAIKIRKFSENKKIFESVCHELLFHECLQFFNTIRHGSFTDRQQRLLAAFQVSSYRFCVTYKPPTWLFSAWTGVCFTDNITFWHSTSYFFKVK